MFKYGIAAATMVLSCSIAAAQEEKTSITPSPKIEKLSWMIGEWDVRQDMGKNEQESLEYMFGAVRMKKEHLGKSLSELPAMIVRLTTPNELTISYSYLKHHRIGFGYYGDAVEKIRWNEGADCYELTGDLRCVDERSWSKTVSRSSYGCKLKLTNLGLEMIGNGDDDFKTEIVRLADGTLRRTGVADDAETKETDFGKGRVVKFNRK